MVVTLVNLSDRYSGTRLLAVLSIKDFNCLSRLSARLSHLRARRICADLISQPDPVITIVPREEWRMRKNSRSSSESVTVRCKM